MVAFQSSLCIVLPAAASDAAVASPELAYVGAVLALAGLVAWPFVVHLARRIFPGRNVFFARWGFTHLAQVVLGFLLAAVVLHRLWPVAPDESFELVLLRGAILFVVAGALAVQLARRVSPEGMRALGLRVDRWGRAVVCGLASYLLLLPAILGLGLFWSWLVVRLGGTWEPQKEALGFLELSGARLAFAVALGVLVIPFFEELLFRGFLQPLLVQNFRDRGGVLLTSFAFAALHGQNAFLPIFGLSLLLGGVMLRTQRLVACWAVHALHNGLMIALFLNVDRLREAMESHVPSLLC